MAQNQGYQSNWTGALQNTQPSQSQPQIQNGQQNNFNGMWTNPQINEPYLFIAPVQSEEAVYNYPVARGVTAILINYSQGVFWKKRQTNDGLGYETVKHRFFTEEEFAKLMTDNNTTHKPTDEVEILRNEIARLRKDFEEFIK